MTDHKKFDRQSLVAQTLVSLRQNVEVLLFGNPADIEQANFAVGGRSEFFPEGGIAPLWIEKLMIEAARENFQFCRIKTALDPALAIFLRVYENGVELAVKPMHVTPGHAFPKTVVGQNANVLREIGVIDATGLQVEHFRSEQSSQPDRAWCTNDDLGKFFPLDVIEHLQNWREAELLQFVFRKFELADRREILDRDIVDLEFAARSHHDQFLPRSRAGRGHFANCRGPAVHVFERVGEPGALAILQDRRDFAGQLAENSAQPGA